MSSLCPIDPLRDGYQFSPADENVSIKLDGGASRIYKDKISSNQYVTLTWAVRTSDYNRLMGFFKETTMYGSEPFRVNLLSDAGVVVPHLCICPDGPPSLVGRVGDTYRVQGTLEVTPNPIRSYGLRFDAIAGVYFVSDNGLSVFGGDLAEFPIGRDVLLTNTDGIACGTTDINVDGTYEIDTAPQPYSITLVDADLVNSGWTTLDGTICEFYIPTNRQGAMILLPQ